MFYLKDVLINVKGIKLFIFSGTISKNDYNTSIYVITNYIFAFQVNSFIKTPFEYKMFKS